MLEVFDKTLQLPSLRTVNFRANALGGVCVGAGLAAHTVTSTFLAALQMVTTLTRVDLSDCGFQNIQVQLLNTFPRTFPTHAPLCKW